MFSGVTKSKKVNGAAAVGYLYGLEGNKCLACR